jgi:hypothetical protein
MGILVKAALLTSLLLSSVSAIPTITAKGAKLFTSDGKQFYNKGRYLLEGGNLPLLTSFRCGIPRNASGSTC